jgi:tetratricopeptide (TPR) repeat protein
MIDPDSAHLLHTGEYAQVLLNVSADPLFRSAALVALGRCGEARQVLLDATQRAAVGDDAVTTLMLRVNLAVLDASTTSGTLAALELALASASAARSWRALCLMHVRLVTLQLRRSAPSATALQLAANKVIVVATALRSASASTKRPRFACDDAASVETAAVLRHVLVPLLEDERVEAPLRHELLRFVNVYVFLAFNSTPHTAGAVAALAHDIAACLRADVSPLCGFPTLLISAHIKLAAGAFEQCASLCSAALELDGAVPPVVRGNAFYVRGCALLAQQQYVGAMSDFDSAMQCAYRFSASALMREVCRLAIGAGDWRAASQVLGSAAQQHSGGGASRADLDAATAMLNLALVFRAADRPEATATMLKLLWESCCRDRQQASAVSATEMVAVCRAVPHAARTIVAASGVRLHSLCDVDAAAMRYWAAKAALQAGQFESALALYVGAAASFPIGGAQNEQRSLLSVDAVRLRRELIYLHLCTGDAARALALSDEVLAAAGADPEVTLLRADAMVVLGMTQPALEALERLETQLADSADRRHAQLRSVARNNRALLHLRFGEEASAVKLLRLLVSAEPHNLPAAFNYCLVARRLGAAYETEACLAWLEARQLPVLDDALKFADLAARRRAALDQLDPRDHSCVGGQPAALGRALDGVVSGAVTQRAALSLDVVVLKRWCTLIADPRRHRQLSEARGRR